MPKETAGADEFCGQPAASKELQEGGTPAMCHRWIMCDWAQVHAKGSGTHRESHQRSSNPLSSLQPFGRGEDGNWCSSPHNSCSWLILWVTYNGFTRCSVSLTEHFHRKYRPSEMCILLLQIMTQFSQEESLSLDVPSLHWLLVLFSQGLRSPKGSGVRDRVLEEWEQRGRAAGNGEQEECLKQSEERPS